MKTALLTLIASVCLTTPAFASPMRTFLVSCAYGAGAGAVVGLTSLAFSDKPSENLSTVARGASLGLYVGIGVGLYLANQPESMKSAFVPWIAPSTDGALAGFTARF
ncbi:MAG: hypothetical protein KF767_16250 [Bdellovibrionaceae bacterium]|nr:hypothetical protein [Pseudobdellovibrionaceae bacterium]